MNRIPFTQQMMFAKVMEDEEICRGFLERLFPERKVRNIKVHKTEKHIVESELAHGVLSKAVRLDVQFDDEEGWHDIEMQVEERPEIPKRSRYYSAIIDVKHLKVGESYLKLKASFVIFICMYDPYKLGEPIYFFERYDVKQNLKMGDESYIIMLNATCEDDKVPETLRGLFAYLKKGAVGEDSLVSQIDRRVELYQKDGEVLHMATLEEHIRWEREYLDNIRAELDNMRVEVESDDGGDGQPFHG